MMQEKDRLENEREISAESEGNRHGAGSCRQTVPAGIASKHRENTLLKVMHVPTWILSELKPHSPEWVRESSAMNGYFCVNKNTSSKNQHEVLFEFNSI